MSDMHHTTSCILPPLAPTPPTTALSHPSTSSMPCSDFLQGTCRYGDNCFFSHDISHLSAYTTPVSSYPHTPFNHFGAEYYVDYNAGFYPYAQRPSSVGLTSQSASPSTTTTSLSAAETEHAFTRRRSSTSLPRRSSCPTNNGKPRRKRTQKFSYGPGTDELYSYLTGAVPALMSAPLSGYFPSDAVLKAHQELEKGTRASFSAPSLEKILLKNPSNTPEEVDPLTSMDTSDNATTISSSSSTGNHVPSLVISVSDSEDDEQVEQPEVEIEKDCRVQELQGRKVGVLGGGVKLGTTQAVRRRGAGMGASDDDPKNGLLSVSTREEDLWSSCDEEEVSTPPMSPKVLVAELTEETVASTDSINQDSHPKVDAEPVSECQGTPDVSSPCLCPATDSMRPASPPFGAPPHGPVPASTTSFSWADEGEDDDGYFSLPVFGSEQPERPKPLPPVAEDIEEEKSDEVTSSSTGSTITPDSPKANSKVSAWVKAPGSSLFPKSASKVIVVPETPAEYSPKPIASTPNNSSPTQSSSSSITPKGGSKVPLFPPEPVSSPSRTSKSKKTTLPQPTVEDGASSSSEKTPTKRSSADSGKNTHKGNNRSRSLKQLASGAHTIRAAPEIYSRLGYQLSPEAAREVEFLRVVEEKRLKREAKAAAALAKNAGSPSDCSRSKVSFSGPPILTQQAQMVANTLYNISLMR